MVLSSVANAALIWDLRVLASGISAENMSTSLRIDASWRVAKLNSEFIHAGRKPCTAASPAVHARDVKRTFSEDLVWTTMSGEALSVADMTSKD